MAVAFVAKTYCDSNSSRPSRGLPQSVGAVVACHCDKLQMVCAASSCDHQGLAPTVQVLRSALCAKSRHKLRKLDCAHALVRLTMP